MQKVPANFSNFLAFPPATSGVLRACPRPGGNHLRSPALLALPIQVRELWDCETDEHSQRATPRVLSVIRPFQTDGRLQRTRKSAQCARRSSQTTRRASRTQTDAPTESSNSSSAYELTLLYNLMACADHSTVRTWDERKRPAEEPSRQHPAEARGAAASHGEDQPCRSTSQNPLRSSHQMGERALHCADLSLFSRRVVRHPSQE